MFNINKYKFISSILITIIITCIFSTAAFASTKYYERYYNKNTKSTPLKYCFLDIVKPDVKPGKTQTTFSKTYNICAVTEAEDVSVMVWIYDKDEDKYEPYKGDDDKSYTTTIGDSGIFVKEIPLNMGVNKIRIIAKKGTKEQISQFNLKRLSDQDMADSVQEDMDNIFDIYDDYYANLD